MEEAVAIDTSTYLGNRPRFMIPSDQLHPIWPPELKARQERYCLDAEQAAVDVVAEEEVSRRGGVAANLEELHKVVLHGHVSRSTTQSKYGTHVLAVNVTTDCSCLDKT